MLRIATRGAASRTGHHANPYGGRVPVRQLPITGVLLVVAVGLALAALGYWRLGTATVAGAVLLAGVLRLALPVRRAGLLVVRSRRIDVVLLVGLGAALLALSGSVPAP